MKIPVTQAGDGTIARSVYLLIPLKHFLVSLTECFIRMVLP